jgi:hypothetical protein
LDYNEFFGPNPLLSQHRSFGLQAGALLTILPFYPFTIDLFDNFLRTVQPPFTPTQSNLDRDTNEAGLRLRFRPGGGRLEFDLQYVFGIDFFEERQLQDLNVYYHKVALHAAWKFLPKTSVWIDISDTPYLYQGTGPGVINHPNSFPLRAIAGLTGLLTTKLSFNLWAGYANGFYQTTAASTGQSPNTGIAGLDIRWKPTVFSSGSIGYKHDFANSLLGSYYDIDSAYIAWSQLIWRFTGSLKLTYSNIRYQDIQLASGLVDNASMPLRSRTDNYLNFDARVDYPFKDWLIGSLGYVLQYNNTNADLASASALATQPIPLNYLKHEVWLRLAVLY